MPGIKKNRIRIRLANGGKRKKGQVRQALEALQAEIDGLSEAVETKTGEDREKLLIYRMLKKQTECVLDDAGEDYQQALDLFRQGDILFQKLSQLKVDHVKLSEIAMKLADPEAVVRLQKARSQLQKLYIEIERLRAKALPTELAENSSARG